MDRTRDISLHLRLSKEEKDVILKRMEFCHIDSINDYIRTMALNGAIIVVDHSDVKRTNFLLSKISTNINQIAHHVNATQTVYSSDVLKLREEMDNIWQLQKSNRYTQL